MPVLTGGLRSCSSIFAKHLCPLRNQVKKGRRAAAFDSQFENAGRESHRPADDAAHLR
jgi:hypothetical protein